MRKLILTLSTVFVFILSAVAQDRTISGKITNENNVPVEGASVATPDGKYGTQTNANGNYSITLPASVKTLSFSFVNFETVTKPIGTGNMTINISLKPSDSKMEEVVVVGYGTQQKKAFTGAAAKVDVKQFSNLITPSVDKQLAGRAPGVQVTVASGTVNSPARIRIRGIQSFNQNNAPLIIVDGNQLLNGDLAALTHSNTLGDINPEDIETIDVLKDGSALAIYGARGAAGVIVITTKKGTKGRSRVKYDMNIGVSSPTKKFNLLHAKDFEVINNEKRTNAGLSILAGTNPSADTVDTDWQSYVMNNNATSQSHTISVEGGTDKTTFYLSANVSDQKGIIITNYNKSYRLRGNLEHEVNKFVKIGNNLTLSRQVDGGNGSDTYNTLGAALPAALRLLPNVSPYSKTGWEGYNIGYPTLATMQVGPNAQTVDDNFNNIAYTFRRNVQNSDKYRIINNAFVEISPVKGLKIRSQVGIDMLNDYSYEGRNMYHGDGFPNGLLNNIDQNWLRLQWTNFLNYNVSFRNHNIFFTVGNEALKQTYKWFGANGTVISDPFFINGNVITNAASQMSISGNHDETGFTAVFGRLNYDFKNKYFAQATLRRDGQSALAPGSKYGLFPGFSLGWRISQESFWRNNKIVNELKLKGSYAKVGNTLTGYPYLSSFSNRPYGNLSGLGPSTVGNPELKWETSAKYNVGVEASLWNSRINLGVDWFLNDVDNLVLAVPQPLSAGIPGSTDVNGGSISQNIGQLENKGVEITLNLGIVRSKNFTWDINANYTNVNMKVTKLFNQGGKPTPFITNGNYLISRVGDPIDILYGYMSAGVNSGNGNPMFYKADGSLIQYNLIRGTGAIGTFYYALSKSDPNLGVATTLTAADKVKLGNTTPTYYGAFTNTFNYKQFGLEVMFRYSGGNKIMNVTAQESFFNQSFQNNGAAIVNRWMKQGDITDVPKLYYGQAAGMNQTGNANSRFVEDGDYIRLQNVIMSYNFNNALLEKRTHGYIKNAKFFVQAQNVYVWTKYSGSDPDNALSPLGTGIDGLVSPPLRTFSLGLSVGF